MSAGVSDQRMKGQGNQVINSASKHVESDDNIIPWSQQVEEAGIENLSSPTEADQSGYYESSSGGGTQFQYPPFNIKEGSWSGNTNKPSRRSSNDNNENDGNYGQSYGQPSSYNCFSGNGDYNTWGSQNVGPGNKGRKGNQYDDYYRSERNNYNNDGVKSIQKGVQNIDLESGDNRAANNSNTAVKTKPANQISTIPKKMTWAHIASQPAKPIMRTSSTSSTLKKKGPGMPPPPMVPGKHNMDIGTWDSPKNGPPLVPPPPPPVIPAPIMEPSPLSQTKSGSNSASNGPAPSGGGGNSSSGNNSSGPDGQKSQKHQQSTQHQYSNQNTSAIPPNAPNNQNDRPPWKSQNNRSQMPGMSNSAQHQRPNINQGHNQSGPVPPINTAYHGPPQSVQHSHPEPQRQSQRSRSPNMVSPPLSNCSSTNITSLKELLDEKKYNPTEMDHEKTNKARFFVIKSYSEDDVHRSIKYEIWCSTEQGNKRLDKAFHERESQGGVVYLFFSVNSSKHFCGVAQMLSPVDYETVSSVWAQKKWKGSFKVKWIYIKDVHNRYFRSICLENNENKPVTHSRDTQEVPLVKGQQFMKIFHEFEHGSWIFDDFSHYEQKQIQEDSKRYESSPGPHNPEGPHPNKHFRGGGGGGSEFGGRGGGSGGGGGFNDKRYHGGVSGPPGGDYRNRNYGRGGYHNFDNRRNDDHRSGFDRLRADGHDGSPSYGPPSRENTGDYHNNRGFHRNDYNRRDDRGYNSRDRENYHDGPNSGFMNRGGDNRGSGYRDQYNRERHDRSDRLGDRSDRGDRMDRDKQDRMDRPDRGERDQIDRGGFNRNNDRMGRSGGDRMDRMIERGGNDRMDRGGMDRSGGIDRGDRIVERSDRSIVSGGDRNDDRVDRMGDRVIVDRGDRSDRDRNDRLSGSDPHSRRPAGGLVRNTGPIHGRN